MERKEHEYLEQHKDLEQTTDIFSYDYQDEYNNILKCFAVNFNLEIFKQ